MDNDTLYGPPSSTLEILLDDPRERDFPDPRRIVGGLAPQDAVRVPSGLPYSVARIVAHMNGNMRFNLGLIHAPDPLQFREREERWPEVPAARWPTVEAEFLSGLAELRRIAREEDLSRILFPAAGAEASWTVGYKLALSVAKHNAYHLGQIVLVRRVLGLWPG